jgi:DNA-binding NarL/FixJ family response regulator
MKILVIDSVGHIATFLGGIDAELASIADEIQALNIAEQMQPDLIMLNYALRGQQTPEYIRLSLSASNASKLVVVGDKLSENEIFDCLLAGANGYQDDQQLADYIDRLVPAVIQGQAWLSRKMVAHLLDAIRQQLSL